MNFEWRPPGRHFRFRRPDLGSGYREPQRAGCGSYSNRRRFLCPARSPRRRASSATRGQFPEILGFNTNATQNSWPSFGTAFFFTKIVTPIARHGKEATLTFANRDLAGLLGLTEAAIRQWLCRAPAFQIGARRGQSRTYNRVEALTIAIAAELFRHHLGRPHEVLPVARQIAVSGSDSIWVHRPAGGPIITTNEKPASTAVHVPLAELRSRLVTH